MFKEPESKLSTPVVVVSLTAVKVLDKSMYPAVKIVVASSLLAITAEQTHLSVATSTRVKTNVPDVNAVVAKPLNKSNPELIAPALAVDVEPLIIDDVPLYPDVTYVGVPPVPNCAVKFPDVPFVDTAYNCNVIRFTQLGILVNPTLVPLTDTTVPAVMTLLAIELTTAPVMAGLVSVLFVSVSVVSLPTKVSVDVGKVKVPVLTIEAMTGLVNVLFVSVSVVARPTKMSVDVGSVSVPVLTIEAITGLVSVLFVSVWVALSKTAWLAGYVTNTFFVPAGKLTKLPELLDSSTVSRLKVVPEEVYVPIPVSQFVPSVMQ